ncbi:MAG: glycosyltransferase family 4 protein [Anaerolineae bacterium]|nr:glycosyltransferase family 4 protein [Anaerolineae bacterium]
MSEPQHTDPPIRIVRITTRLNITGPAVQVVLLTAKMREHGYETKLVAGSVPSDETQILDNAKKYGVEAHFIPPMDKTINPIVLILALRQLVRIIRDYQPHIVHTHTTTAGFLGRVAARIARVPVTVHTLHVYPFEGYYNRITTSIFIWIERMGARLSDSIITLSEGLRRQMTEKYPITRKQRITVLPLGLDLTSFMQTGRYRGLFRKEHNIPADVPLVGIIGQLIPVKNHALFLQAAQQVKVAVPNAHFVIIGDGDLHATLEQQAQSLGLVDAVTFTGWIGNVAHAYCDIDVIVNCSLNEGTPLPLIEALAAGCPVVATQVGGMPDLLDGGRLGALVPPNDPDALAQAILKTLKTDYDPEPAQEAMLNRYGIDRLTQDLDSLYRGLLAKKQVTLTKPPQA